jgi:hypothetical protein
LHKPIAIRFGNATGLRKPESTGNPDFSGSSRFGAQTLVLATNPPLRVQETD